MFRASVYSYITFTDTKDYFMIPRGVSSTFLRVTACELLSGVALCVCLQNANVVAFGKENRF